MVQVIPSQYCYLPFFFLLDIDECEEGSHKCPSQDKCSNSPGSFSCRTDHPGEAPEEEEDSFVGNKCYVFYKFVLKSPL